MKDFNIELKFFVIPSVNESTNVITHAIANGGYIVEKRALRVNGFPEEKVILQQAEMAVRDVFARLIHDAEKIETANV